MSKWLRKKSFSALLAGSGNWKCKFVFKLNSAYLTPVLICNLWEHALFIIFPKIREQSHTLYFKQSRSHLHFLTHRVTQRAYLTVSELLLWMFEMFSGYAISHQVYQSQGCMDIKMSRSVNTSVTGPWYNFFFFKKSK